MDTMLEKLQQRVSDRDAALEVSTGDISLVSLWLSLWAEPRPTTCSVCSSWASLPEEPSERQS